MTDTAILERTDRKARLAIVDCDIHPIMRTPTEILDFLPERWRRHLQDYGARAPRPFLRAIPYPRMTPGGGVRMDAWPPNGGPPGSDLDFLRAQHLDPNNVEFGMLQPLAAGSSVFDQALGAAMCAAINDWQIARWTSQDKRLKASICVTQEDPDAAIAEIERRAGDPTFAQIAVPPRTIEPFGRRRYWRLIEAAVAHNLPIGLHSAAFGPHTNSGTGWLSFYIEEHYAFAFSLQTVVSSLIMEGVFERYPGLKIVAIEGGFAWAPSLAWRLDKHWARMRSEVPQVKRPPSEYMREHIWYTTQPIEEPERPGDLLDTIRWIGADRLMFSTDYPHWDYDDPASAFKVKLSEEQKRLIFGDNARKLYRLG